MSDTQRQPPLPGSVLESIDTAAQRLVDETVPNANEITERARVFLQAVYPEVLEHGLEVAAVVAERRDEALVADDTAIAERGAKPGITKRDRLSIERVAQVALVKRLAAAFDLSEYTGDLVRAEIDRVWSKPVKPNPRGRSARAPRKIPRK